MRAGPLRAATRVPAWADRHARAAGWLAVVAALVGEVLLVTSGLLASATARASGGMVDWVDTVLWTAAWAGFAVVGAVVVTRRPSNAVGWTLVGITTALGFVLFAAEYAELGTTPGRTPLPLHGALVVAGNALQVVPFALVPLLLVLFPDGRLPDGRMRRVVALGALLVAVDTLAYLFRDGPVSGAGGAVNPLGIPGTAAVGRVVTDVAGTLVGMLSLVVVGDFVRRFREATGVRRQQFRWVARAAVVAPALFLVGLAVGPLDRPGVTDWTDLVILAAFAVGLPALAAGIGVAVLRHRLWDIDRVVSRTVSYAVLTVLLVGCYTGLVLVVQAVLGPDDPPDVVVAGSTLVVAAVARPLHRRVQGLVDRRFDRARADHAAVVADLGVELRRDVAVADVADDLLVAVGRAAAPRQAEVWLAPPRNAVGTMGSYTWTPTRRSRWR